MGLSNNSDYVPSLICYNSHLHKFQNRDITSQKIKRETHVFQTETPMGQKKETEIKL